jgi:MinD-like ATPase involved in chromosome partitioning or flagellar assembly
LSEVTDRQENAADGHPAAPGPDTAPDQPASPRTAGPKVEPKYTISAQSAGTAQYPIPPQFPIVPQPAETSETVVVAQQSWPRPTLSAAATPRPEDLLVPTRSPLAAEPATWGWRGRLNRGSGGLFKTKPAPQEMLARQAIIDVQRGFSRPMTVVVVQPKGGAGKTPTTVCLSAVFGAHRGGYVVGWDDNETRGTLAVRVDNPDNQRVTVWDLLRDLKHFERADARVGDLSYYVRPQPGAHFDALVSDDSPGNMAQIGEEEFRRLHRVLQRFYRLVVIDTGNNVRSPNWQAAVNAADVVVLVSTYQRDVGYSGSWVLDHLTQTGREELAHNAVTVLTAADPAPDKAVRQRLVAHFAARTRAVVEIPFDPELAHGGPIRWTALAPRTRHAWVEAGAWIANALAEHDERADADRQA